MLRSDLAGAAPASSGYDEGMDALFPFLTPATALLAFGVAILAGMVKGMVGFAMPMILISGLGTFLPPEIALGGLLLPTLVTNGMQALRHGARAAWASVRHFRVFLLAMLVFLLLTAQLVPLISAQHFLLMLGIPVTGFALIQLLGLKLTLAAQNPRIEAVIGSVAGAIGGISGVWGPPTVMYLTALGTPKADQMRVQGVIYGLGAVALVLAHLGSGVLRAETAPFSLALIVPAVAGMYVGGKLSDRIDQTTFRRATLIVLLVAGVNLVRRGLF